MTDYPKWSDVKKQLDDPSVSAGDKNRLLTQYAYEAGYGKPNLFNPGALVNPDFLANKDEIDDYAKKYNATDSFDNVSKLNNGFMGKDADAEMQAAHQQAYQDQLQRTKNTQQASQAKSQLSDESKKTVAQGGSGAATSDEILEPGSRGMYYFQYFIPPYKNWTGNAPDLDKDIRNVYDNLRGIQFAKFRADATQLSTSHGKLSDITLNLSTDTNSLGGFWQGPAAQAAQQYCGTFVQNGTTVTDGTSAASQVIDDSMKAIETAVLQRAQSVLKLYADDIGGFTPENIQMIIDAAKMNADDDELKSMSKWNVFSNVDWGDTKCGGGLTQNVKNLAAMDASNWLNQTFVPNFDSKKQSFDSITKSTHDTVSQSFDSMNQGLGKIAANPFSDLSKGIQVPSAGASGGQGSGGGSGSGGTGAGGGATAPSGAGGGGSAGGGSAGGGSAGGGSAGGGSGAGGGSTAPSGAGGGGSAAMPPIPPQTPTTTSGAPTTPSTPSTPSVPTTPTMPTLPSSTDPTTGAPTTGMPTTGTPPPETTTVQHGNSTLSMTSPDSQGMVQLTTKDANGQSHTYDVDFGKGGTTGQQTGAIPVTSHEATQTAVPTTGTSGGQDPNGMMQGQQPGDPSGAQAPGADGAQHITPDADGNAVIHDGSTTITAHEESNGQVQITVDDGSGQPTTYTIGQSADPSQTAGFTDPSQTADLTSQTSSFTDPSQTGFTDPSQAAGFTDPSQAAGFTDPSQAAGFTDPSQSVGFTDPSQSGGFTDPSQFGGTDTSGGGQFTDPSSGQFTDPSTVGNPQVTTLAAAMQPAPSGPDAGGGLGGVVGGGMHSGAPDGGAGLASIGGGIHHDGGGAAGFAGGGGMGHPGGGHPDLGGQGLGGQVGGHATDDHLVGGHYDHHGGDESMAQPGHAGVAGQNVTPLGQPGGAGLASAPPDALGQGGDQGQQGQQGQSGGMPMMGGGGAGGGQGGDQTRGGSHWRTEGRLFEDIGDEGIGRFSGTLDDGR